jgi:TP901 family phage tail tape measure protein
MADVQSNIHVNIDTSDALASLKLLQRQISAFHTQMSKSGAAASAVAANQAQNLMNSINATGKFQASMRTVATSTEYFTNALEKNKLTSREYFRYTGAATKTFGRLFRSEFETINKVARERVKDIQTQYIKMGRGANGALQAIAVRPLTLDMKNLATQTAMAAQRQQLLNQLLKQGSTNLLNFGKNTQWAGRQLMVGFTVPLMLLGSTAAKTFMKLEEQAIRFKRVYGEMFTTAEETDAMVKQIQTLAKEYTKYGVAVEKTMEMAANAAAMGKMGAELTAQVTEATRLAVLGGVEQEQALETTISVTNAFGVAAEDLAKKIDFLNAVENQTVVSIEDLTIAIPKAGPVVQQLGGDVEDLAFFLTAMKEGGINASEGANALKSGLASLINPSEKASKMLAGLGINIKGIVEANKGDVAATVVGFAQALDTLDPLNRARAIEQLFGKFQFSRLSTLFQNVTAQGSQAARVLGLTRATTEELAILSQRELDKIENTTTYKFKKSIEDLKVTLAPVGEQFLKALTPIVEFASKILEKFNNLGEGSKKFLTILTVALGAVGPIALMTFGLLANGLANIIKLFATMKSSFNRAGSSTQILGNQTDYLTQQQLEASAVAASLDQVHQKLRQTFTSETAAVEALASAYRRAIAAQVGFTGPVGRGKLPQSKRYSTGVDRVPGPMGAGDIVPAMLEPGEAVIPAKEAQDPANRPIIKDMIAGKPVSEITKKKSRVKPDTVFAHATQPQKMQTANIPDDFSDTRETLRGRGIEKALGYRGLGFDIPGEMNNALKDNKVNVKDYLREISKPRAVETMVSRLMKENGLSATDAERVANKLRKNLILSLQGLPDDFKIGDRTVYSRMGNLTTGILGGLAKDPKYKTAIEQIYKVVGVGGASASVMKYNSKMPVEDVIKNIKNYTPATNPATIKALEQIALKQPGMMLDVNKNGDIVTSYERLELHNKKRFPDNPEKWEWSDKKVNAARQVDPKTGNLIMKPGRSGGDTGAVKIGGTAGKKVLDKARAVLQGLTAQDIDGRPITTYAKQLEKGTGYSNIAARDASGVFLTEDGKKVYVKPFPDLRSALAEQRATVIARDVHGLDAPNQELRVVKDPYTGKTMFALESKYDSKFTPKELSSSFSREEYFRQLVASSLRGDDDLKKGNLGGNRLVDVGKAGVLDKASGVRGYAEKMPSMLEMAEKNLSGVKGPAAGKSPFWFGNATADIAKSMTADQYHKAMIDEIDRTLPKLKATIAKFDLGPEDRKYYQAMIDRLEEGRKVDWRGLHAKHSSILIKPDELIEDEKTGKLEKPKTTKKPRGVKSSSGSPKDTRMTDKPKKGKRVVQGPRGKFTVPGFANAPESANAVASSIVAGARSSIAEAKSTGQKIGLTISQSAAAASRTALYGTGPIDANQKSLRRKLQKMERDQKRLSKIAQQAPVPQPVIAANMADGAEKQTLRGRAKTYLQNRETKKQARIAAGKGPGMGVGGAAMAVSGIAMLGSMAPGKVGEISQKLMMPLMGLAMVLPMLKSPAMAVVAGLTATVGAFIMLRRAFDQAQEKILQENEKFRGSTSAINSIAKFGGKVTASEQMDLRRKNSFSMLGPATGKTTYGEAFVQTKEGKELTERLSKQAAAGKGTQAASDLSQQLSAAIMSGAMDMNQAKSLAMNAAEQAGDLSIGLKVVAQMEKMLGPNGEDLSKNPLEVRTRMVAENQKRMQSNLSNIQNAGIVTKLAGQKTMQKVGIGASAAGGAAIGATLGAALGSVVPVLGNAVGAIIGGGIGAAAGAIGGYFASKKFAAQAGQLGAAYAVDAKIAMEQNKQMLDSFDMYYQKKIEELRLQGKINEAEEMQNKYIEERDKLTAAQAQLQGDIVKQYNEGGALQESMMSGMKKAAKARYKDNPNEIAYMDVVNQQAGDLRKSGAIDKGQEFLIQAKMASGDIPPSVFRNLLQMATENKEIAPKMMNIITKFSGATSESIGVAAQNILGSDNTIDKTVQTQFITKVEAFEEDSEALDFAKNMIKLNNLNAVIPSNVLVKYYTENDAAYQQLNKMLDAIEGKKDLTVPFVYEIIPQLKGSDAFDEKYFETLTEDQQKVYTTTIASIINIPDPQIVATDDYQTWLKENTVVNGKTYGGAQYKGLSQAAMVAHYKEQQGFKAVTDNVAISAAAPKGSGGGGGSKPKSSPLDDLLKRLRDVRKNQIKVTEGFDASFKSLNKLFGGKKTIEIFSGIENDMRKLGAGEDLIELIVGMDPKEYEKQKNKLFEFDKKGNIIKIKDGAKSIGDALQSVKLGEFVSEQQKMANQIGNQTAALKRLQAAGVEGSVALEAVADATFAAAIANKKLSDEQIQKIVKTWKKATKAANAYAANEAAINKTKEFTDRAKLLTQITAQSAAIAAKANASQGSVIEALLNNPELATMLITPGIDQDAFEKLLQQALDSARTELKIKQLTIEGMQDIFDTGYGNAMEAFDVEEQRLRFKFEDDNKKLKDEIKKAEELIAVKQEQIRIQEIGLKEIEDQEEKVNKKYDERLKALDEVEKANATISQQQKGQLTLAEALTSGDIAAAARAAQEMRAASAADAVTKQKDALEKSREYELSQIRSKNGKSRIEIENEIKKLQDEIYEIEQKSLEPNRETLRLNELALEKAIEGITVLDKTRDAWERIKNQVDLARISSAQFVKEMQDALNIMNSLINAYRNQTVKTDPIIPTDPTIPTNPIIPSGTTCDEGYELVNGNCVKKGTVVSEEAETTQGPCGPTKPYYNYFTGECVGSPAEIKPRGTTTTSNNNNTSTSSSSPSSSSSSTEPLGVNTGGLVAQMHLDDLNRMALNMEVAKITQNAGSVAGLHYKELVTMSDRAAAFTKELEDAAERKKIVNMGGSTPYLHLESLSAKAQKASADAFTAELKAAEEKRKADEAAKKKAAADIARFGGNAIAANQFANWGKAKGGLIKKFSMGGIIPRFLSGGFAKGTDTVPAMLTPGEFVMSKYAVDSYGVDNMKKINSGDPISGTVYNNTYTLTVNAKTDANPNEIAQAVMATIKQVDDRRVRGVVIGARK